MVLTRFERNEIFEIIKRSDIAVADCDTYATVDSTIFTHKSGSEIEFQLGGKSGDEDLYKISARVFDGKSPRMPHGPIELERAAPFIYAWATEIKRISETPDYWAEMPRARGMIVDIQWADDGNASFTRDEQRQIVLELETIKQHAKEQFDLTPEQTAHIDEGLDLAAEASTRLGRKDWRLLFYGTVLNLMVNDAIPPNVAQHIFTTVVQGLIHLFTGAGGPPQILG
jgi:hypothetical protein